MLFTAVHRAADSRWLPVYTRLVSVAKLMSNGKERLLTDPEGTPARKRCADSTGLITEPGYPMGPLGSGWFHRKRSFVTLHSVGCAAARKPSRSPEDESAVQLEVITNKRRSGGVGVACIFTAHGSLAGRPDKVCRRSVNGREIALRAIRKSCQ